MKNRLELGFTLVELLVVIVIISILAGLVLSAVQQAREAGRRTQCANNLRQIGIALQSYHNTHSMFPPGCVGIVGDPVNIQGWGWGTFLLPEVEQISLYDALNPTQNTLAAVIASNTLQPLLQTPLSMYRCASDTGDDIQSAERTLSGFVAQGDANGNASNHRARGIEARDLVLFACIIPPPDPTPSHNTTPSGYGVRAATSNYVASFGDFWLSDEARWTDADYAGNGVFGSNVSVRMQDITDGASHTFAIGERSWNSYASIWAGTDGWDRCEREGAPMGMATAYYQLNSAADPYYLSCDPKGAAGYGSMHPHGANFLMADGSARFVANSIAFANSDDPTKLGAFQRLARRNDGLPGVDF